MAKSLDKYIFREIGSFFALSLGVFTFVLLLGKTLSLAELVVVRGVGLGRTLELVVFLVPPFLAITIPMALLTSTSIAFSRLSADNEILVMQASGLSPLRLMAPAAFFSLLSLAVSLWLSLYLAPSANHLFRGSLFEMVNSKAYFEIKEKSFNNFFDGLLLYADEVLEQNAHLRGILISDERVPDNPRVITAQEGDVLSDQEDKQVYIRLSNGAIHPNSNIADGYTLISFQRYDIQLDLKESLARSATAAKRGKEMGLLELRDRMQKLGRESKNYRQLLMEYHKRFAIPASTIFLGLVGAMVGMVNRRSGKLGGFSAALAIILVYYLLFMGGEGLSNEGKISPFWAAWGANFFVAATALAAFGLNSQRIRSLSEKLASVRRRGKQFGGRPR